MDCSENALGASSESAQADEVPLFAREIEKEKSGIAPHGKLWLAKPEAKAGCKPRHARSAARYVYRPSALRQVSKAGETLPAQSFGG